MRSVRVERRGGDVLVKESVVVRIVVYDDKSLRVYKVSVDGAGVGDVSRDLERHLREKWL